MLNNTLWTERYRPETIEDYVWINDGQRQQVESWIKEGDLPHLLLSGGPGVGKSSIAKLLMKELNVDPSDIKFVNASQHTGIDYIRDLVNFIETMPTGKYRYVILDECLDENTFVTVLRNGEVSSIKIKDLDEKNDLVKSYNLEKEKIEWRPFELIDKGTQETIEIEFNNGEIIICTPTHKWYVEDPATLQPIIVQAKDLFNYNHILTL